MDWNCKKMVIRCLRRTNFMQTEGLRVTVLFIYIMEGVMTVMQLCIDFTNGIIIPFSSNGDAEDVQINCFYKLNFLFCERHLSVGIVAVAKMRASAALFARVCWSD